MRGGGWHWSKHELVPGISNRASAVWLLTCTPAATPSNNMVDIISQTAALVASMSLMFACVLMATPTLKHRTIHAADFHSLVVITQKEGQENFANASVFETGFDDDTSRRH